VWDVVYASCDQATQELLDRHLFFLRQKGNLCERPISAPLGDGLFELRAKSARMIYIFRPQRTIIFVHCFIKKVRSVPPAEIKLAKKRRNEIEKGTAKLNALPD
jgi:phage-related protein